jgi:hypothetical protein
MSGPQVAGVTVRLGDGANKCGNFADFLGDVTKGVTGGDDFRAVVRICD